MGKRLDINITFQNAAELEEVKDSIIIAVKNAVGVADLSEPGVTVEVNVVEDV